MGGRRWEVGGRESTVERANLQYQMTASTNEEYWYKTHDQT